jgi:hypothetical protein
MLSTDATATPLRRYSAEVTTRQIIYKGRSYRPGDRIEILGTDVDTLREAGVIGAIKRLESTVETAVVAAPEDASRNYKRRPR